MKFALWLEKKTDELLANYSAPGARFKQGCLRVLIFIAQRCYWEQYNYYACKARFFFWVAARFSAAAEAAKKREGRKNG